MYGTEYGVENIQHQIMDVLKCIDKVCRENGIQYSLHGGTLLGAVREKGFIPWDDDADISMTRENFNRFASVFCKVQNTYQILCDDGWVWQISPKDRCEADERICVDLFIYDFVSERPLARKTKILLLSMLQGMLKSNIDWTAYHGLSMCLTFVTYVMGKPFSKARKLKWYDSISEHWFCGSRKLIFRTNDKFESLRMIYPKQVMDECRNVKFEDARFLAAMGYKRILISCYGRDYMTPPAESERVPGHRG